MSTNTKTTTGASKTEKANAEAVKTNDAAFKEAQAKTAATKAPLAGTAAPLESKGGLPVPPQSKGAADEAMAEPGKPGGWATPAGQETPTQMETEAPANIASDSQGRDQKIVYAGRLGGEVPAGERTTIKEEVVTLRDDQVTDDLDAQIHTMQVLARTQGINQTVVRGQKKNDDGIMCNEVLVVFQDGHHTTDLVPVDTNPSEEKKAAGK